MNFEGILLAVIAPIGGWALFVERRLSRLESMKDTLDKVDHKVETLVEHLMGEHGKDSRQTERR